MWRIFIMKSWLVWAFCTSQFHFLIFKMFWYPGITLGVHQVSLWEKCHFHLEALSLFCVLPFSCGQPWAALVSTSGLPSHAHFPQSANAGHWQGGFHPWHLQAPLCVARPSLQPLLIGLSPTSLSACSRNNNTPRSSRGPWHPQMPSQDPQSFRPRCLRVSPLWRLAFAEPSHLGYVRISEHPSLPGRPSALLALLWLALELPYVP